MKIALAQLNCPEKDYHLHFTKIEKYVAQASQHKCRVVIFPELADTGYNPKHILCNSEKISRENQNFFSKLAIDYDIFIFAGIVEMENGKRYNTLRSFSPQNENFPVYKKLHLADYPPLNEGKLVHAGRQLVTVEIDGIRFGMQICYDLRFPEPARLLALNGVHVLVYSAAWPFPRNVHWNVLTKARAIENQVYVAAVNHVGPEGRHTFCGSSALIDSYGTIVNSASEIDETLVMGEICPENIHKTRERMPIFSQRREDIYSFKKLT